jgi:membrane fusion protein, heavy metal efflux system
VSPFNLGLRLGGAFVLCLTAFVSSFACRKPAAPSLEPKASVPDAHEKRDETPGRVTLTAAAISEAGITTWQVKPVDLEHLLVLTGNVSADENHLLQVASNVRGRVASIGADLGAWVRKGDTLLVIESVELAKAREEFLRETAALRVAARSYERAKGLVEAEAISIGELETREGEYLSRKAAAQGAERTLRALGDGEETVRRLKTAAESDGERGTAGAAQLTVSAPFDGRIIDRKVTPGALVEALQPLMTVANLRTVWVFLQAYEKDLALLSAGLPVTIRAEAYPQDSFKGRIDVVGSTVDTATRTVRMRATVDNRAEKLKPGMFITAHVDVPKPEAEAKLILVVPQSALQTLEGRTVLFAQAEPGVFERRLVEVGHSFEGFTEVLAGVKAGDIVVTEGSFVVKSEFAKASLVEQD